MVAHPNIKATKATSAKIPGLEPEPPRLAAWMELSSVMLTSVTAYGNKGCRVFKQGVQNWKDFCLKINIPKEVIEF